MYSVSEILSEGIEFRMLASPPPNPAHLECYRKGISFQLHMQFQEHILTTSLQLNDIWFDVEGMDLHISLMGRSDFLYFSDSY